MFALWNTGTTPCQMCVCCALVPKRPCLLRCCRIQDVAELMSLNGYSEIIGSPDTLCGRINCVHTIFVLSVVAFLTTTVNFVWLKSAKMDQLFLAFGDVKRQRSGGTDSFCDRLNCTYTMYVLIAFSVIVTSRAYVGDQVSCWCPSHFTDSHIEYTNQVCV